MHELVPILAIICAIGLPLSIPIVYLVLNHRKNRRLMELHHAERMAAIERGMDIPPLQTYDFLPQQPRRRSTLLPGLVWLFVGIALIVGSYESGDFGFSSFPIWGLVPTGVGLAYLIYYFVEDRKAKTHLSKPRGAGSEKENP